MAVIENLLLIAQDSALSLEYARELDHAGRHVLDEADDPASIAGAELGEDLVNKSVAFNQQKVGSVAAIGH
jgi:hypothetical protein